MVDILVRAKDIFAGVAGRPPLVAIGKTKFFSLVKTGDFPPPDARIGGAVVWKLSTVQRWISEACSSEKDAQ